MSISQSVKDFGRRTLLTGGIIVALSGCDKEKGIGQIVDDFNNDGRSDIVTVSYDRDGRPLTQGWAVSYDAYLSLGLKDGRFSSQKKVLHFRLKPENLQVGDVDGDGKKDLLFIAYDRDGRPLTQGWAVSYDQYAALGRGNGNFLSPKKILHYNVKPEF